MQYDEKRKQRAYKIKDTPYNKAMKRAFKDKTNLASLVERFVTDYSEGLVKLNPQSF